MTIADMDRDNLQFQAVQRARDAILSLATSIPDAKWSSIIAAVDELHSTAYTLGYHRGGTEARRAAVEAFKSSMNTERT